MYVCVWRWLFDINHCLLKNFSAKWLRPSRTGKTSYVMKNSQNSTNLHIQNDFVIIFFFFFFGRISFFICWSSCLHSHRFESCLRSVQHFEYFIFVSAFKWFKYRSFDVSSSHNHFIIRLDCTLEYETKQHDSRYECIKKKKKKDRKNENDVEHYPKIASTLRNCTNSTFSVGAAFLFILFSFFFSTVKQYRNGRVKRH